MEAKSTLLFAYDTALVADSEKKLYQLVEEFDCVCRRKNLRVNRNKSKVIKCTRGVSGRRMNVALNDELLEEVEEVVVWWYVCVRECMRVLACSKFSKFGYTGYTQNIFGYILYFFSLSSLPLLLV